MLTTAALTLGLLFTSMKGHQMIEAATGCGWSGHMPGPGGIRPCPSPVSSQTRPLTPSYRQVQSQVNRLWPCPSYTRSTGGQYYGNCTNGEGSNPLCTNFNPTTSLGCCCLLDGWWTPPYFNWIIGVCKGSGYGNYEGCTSYPGV